MEIHVAQSRVPVSRVKIGMWKAPTRHPAGQRRAHGWKKPGAIPAQKLERASDRVRSWSP